MVVPPEVDPVKTGHYVGLKFEEGWFFVHVLETEDIHLKPWIMLNENDSRSTISAQTMGSEDEEFVDEVNRKLLEPESNSQNIIFQTMFGAAPSRIQLYPRFGRNSRPNLVGGADETNSQVPVTGYDSPYNDPSAQGEFFMVDDMEDFALQAYNPHSEPVEARASVYVNKFRYAVVDDVEVMKGFIQGQLPFKDHVMGLGAQTNEQMKAPGWMIDMFGDSIKTTREILESGGAGSGSTGSTDIPAPNME